MSHSRTHRALLDTLAQATMSSLRFYKYEGLGNDFVVVDVPDDSLFGPDLAAKICDRHRGVGADGVILNLPPLPGGYPRMRIYNADGSIPEMCGNGIRCLALHLARGSSSMVIQSDAGPRLCEVDLEARSIRVDMGVVRVGSAVALHVAGRAVQLQEADAGNPHAVTFDEFTADEHRVLGPQLSTHAQFPRGANIEFLRHTGDGLDVVGWERGSGLTQACGTGACAAAAVAAHRGLSPYGQPIRVRLPGGVLRITCDPSGQTFMEGPARKVFEGTLDLGAFA
jgi:diaminopimelate epimerase